MNSVLNGEYTLQLESVTKSYGKFKALDRLSMHVRRNEVLGLIGENGAGKSTLLKILGGIHQFDSGSLKINGKPCQLKGPEAASRAGIGVVHQEQSLLDNLSVAENISLGSSFSLSEGRQRRLSRFGFFNWRAIHDEGAAALAHIGSTVSPKALVGSLSFADKQMVEIAKAVRMASRPGMQPLIILDEPTSVLEKDDIARLEAEIERLRKIGSVIFVSHRLDEIRRVCDRVYVMRSGEIVAERESEDIDPDELFEIMTGRKAVARRELPSYQQLDAEAAVRVEHLSKRGEFADVSLAIDKGKVHVLVGTRNSGREALSRVLFGIESYDSGTIRLDGHVAMQMSVPKAIASGIGYLPSERKLEGMIPGSSLVENMHLTHPRTAAGVILQHDAESHATVDWIRKLDIRPALPTADISRLSGGNQQKVVLAKWALDPTLKLMILDHPTRGLDPGAREHVETLIGEMCARGVGVLLLADSLDEALAIAHRITVMKDGRVSASFDLDAGDVPTSAQLVQYMV